MSEGLTPEGSAHAEYWDGLAKTYQEETHISLDDFHYGPLLPGDKELQLLPSQLKGKTCLELGCGAGQNSIVLAKAGAECISIDVSEHMLEYGRLLANQEGVSSDFRKADQDALPKFGTSFDLIHSAYGVPFSSDPKQLIQNCADLLNPDGVLLFSMGHPVYAGEWLELDEDQGLFLQNYFHPTPDVREGDGDAVSRAYPLSEVTEWIHQAGLQLDRILEPTALSETRLQEAPYYSKGWAEQAEELRRFPIVVIIKAVKN